MGILNRQLKTLLSHQCIKDLVQYVVKIIGSQNIVV